MLAGVSTARLAHTTTSSVWGMALPSGLESLWTYIDPSTTQGVFSGVLLFVVAVGLLSAFFLLGRWSKQADQDHEE